MDFNQSVQIKLRLRRGFASLVLASTLIVGAVAGLIPALSCAQEQTVAISGAKLEKAIGERIVQVPEFEYIRQEAERLGVRTYLFGGTAAGFAHYVKWDLEREGGGNQYQKERFDYDFTNIYHSTQDLDIVVDGPPQVAQELQRRLAEKFPHLQGNKTAWEVRLLRESIKDKQALLHNSDFLNQHTDSNSTGMIEITRPAQGDPIVRDLRDWDAPSQHREPNFLKDVREGMLHYYYSPLHETTQFFKEGRNPPIISAIRYLTKAFQYGLKMRDEDLAHIKKIIDQFDPHGPEMQNSYVRHWLLDKENGRKLVKGAVDIEYALDTLQKLGLKDKLIAIEANPEVQDSLAWWLSKEALKSSPVGLEDGKTAKELGITSVAHDTRTFLAYESISRSPTGAPNVFISRPGVNGEAAFHGPGFYTLKGDVGAYGNGITVRFKVDPNARLGTDFTMAPGNIVVFHNKNALQVIPESLSLTPLEYLRSIQESQSELPGALKNFAVLEKLKRRMRTAVVTPEISNGLWQQIKKWREEGVLKLSTLEKWAEISKMSPQEFHLRALELLSMPNAAPEPLRFYEILASKSGKPVKELLREQEIILNHDRLPMAEFEKRASDLLQVDSREFQKDKGRLVFGNFNSPDWIKLKADPNFENLLARAFSNPQAIFPGLLQNRDLTELAIKKGDVKLLKYIGEIVAPKIESGLKPLVHQLIEYGNHEVLVVLSCNAFKKENSRGFNDLIRTVIEKGDQTIWGRLLKYAFPPSFFEERKELLSLLIRLGGGESYLALARQAFSRPEATVLADQLRMFLEETLSPHILTELINYALAEPHWQSPEFKAYFEASKITDRNQRIAFLNQHFGPAHPVDFSKITRREDWVRAFSSQKVDRSPAWIQSISRPHLAVGSNMVSEAMSGNRNPNLEGITDDELSVVANWMTQGEAALPEFMKAEPYEVGGYKGFNSIRFKNGTTVKKNPLTAKGMIVEMGARGRVDLLREVILKPGFKDGLTRGSGEASVYHTHDLAVGELVKLYQKDPENAQIAEILEMAIQRPEVHTRLIILKGIQGIHTPSSLQIITLALADRNPLEMGEGSQRASYARYLYQTAAELFDHHPLHTNLGPRFVKSGDSRCIQIQLAKELHSEL